MTHTAPVLARLAVCVGSLATLSACGHSNTEHMMHSALGVENDVRVVSVASIDEAFFLPGRGLLLCGRAAPGDEAFALGIPLAGLAQPQPAMLSYERFSTPFWGYTPESGDGCACAAALPEARRIPVSGPGAIALVNPPGVAPEALTLEQQQLHVDPLPDVPGTPADLQLGPRGGNGAYWLLTPLALAGDAPLVAVGAATLVVAAPIAGLHYLFDDPEPPRPPPAPRPGWEPCNRMFWADLNPRMPD
jgi:hypothetical protein